jgi:hypothetical protein
MFDHVDREEPVKRRNEPNSPTVKRAGDGWMDDGWRESVLAIRTTCLLRKRIIRSPTTIGSLVQTIQRSQTAMNDRDGCTTLFVLGLACQP